MLSAGENAQKSKTVWTLRFCCASTQYDHQSVPLAPPPLYSIISINHWLISSRQCRAHAKRTYRCDWIQCYMHLLRVGRHSNAKAFYYACNQQRRSTAQNNNICFGRTSEPLLEPGRWWWLGGINLRVIEFGTAGGASVACVLFRCYCGRAFVCFVTWTRASHNICMFVGVCWVVVPQRYFDID